MSPPPTTLHGARRHELPSIPALTRQQGHPLDLVAVLAVPVGLLGLYALPAATKEPLALSYTEPTLAAALASHYVHFSAGHLLANLAGYLALVPLAYLLSVASGRRRAFLVAFWTFLLVVPLALSALNVLLARPSVGYGFSGVVMAFLGYLPFAVFWHLEAHFDARFGADQTPALYLIGLALIAAWAVPASPTTVAVVVVAGGTALAYLHALRQPVSRLLVDSLRGPPPSVGHLELLVAGLLLFLCFPAAAFPPEPVSPGVVVNLYSHLLGYSLGFLASFGTFALAGVR